MSRSLKKGPYISVKLDKKVAAMERVGQKVCNQNMVESIYDFSGFRRTYFRSTQW